MWYPITLRIKNLFTHQETVFHFKRNEMILLLGLNEDQEGSNSNGSGKSAILDALILAITGETYRAVTKDEFIRKGTTECNVNLTLLHPTTKERLILHREFFLGNKASSLTICINENPLKEFLDKNKMKRNAQEFIYDKLGISKDDLLNYFIIGEGNDSCFLTASDGKQKEVISRFSNYSKVDRIVDKIKEDLDCVEDEINLNGADLQTRINHVAQLEQFIESLESNSEYEEKKTSLQEQLQELEEVYEETNKRAKETLIEVNAFKIQIGNVQKTIKEKTDINTLNKNLNNLRGLKEELEATIDEIKEIKSKLIVRSGEMIVCPKCKWQFLPNDNMTVKELEASKKHVESELLKADRKWSRQEQEINELKSTIKIAEKLEDLNNKLKIKTYNLANYNERLEDRDKQIQLKKKEILNLKKNLGNQKLIKEQQLHIKEAKEEIKDLEERHEVLAKKKESLNFHLFVFEKQFRTYIANKTIRTIQDIINYYFQKFHMDMRVMINGYTILKSGDVREKIQIWVIKNGKERVLFKGLSKGERGRAALCSVIAMNRLLNNASEGNGLAFLGLDEFLEGLDATGQDQCIQIMEHLKMTSLLIMHHSESIKCKNKVVVEKKNGISKLINK